MKIQHRSVTYSVAASILALTILLSASAAETRFWQQTDQTDFEKGTLTPF